MRKSRLKAEEIQKTCDDFDQRFKPGCLNHEEATNLIIEVIAQALDDATLGVSRRLAQGLQPRLVKHPMDGLRGVDVIQARYFIKGQDGALLDFCAAIGADYEATKQALLKVYVMCQPWLVPEWQDQKVILTHRQGTKSPENC